ncbi:MAG: XrtN system VIT domain-containing protein [Bacteroidia bacterium]|nr:XrtN system VIT domain-containing protein [Bacteroidia bacterium]
MEHSADHNKDTRFHQLGYALLLICSTLAALDIWFFNWYAAWFERSFRMGFDMICGMFCIAASILYFVTLMVVRWKRFKETGRVGEISYSIALLLFSLGAHMLNNVMHVFAPYTGWLQAYMWAIHGAILLYPYRRELPTWAQYGVYAICGAGLTLTVYLCVYLLPVMLIAVPAVILLGISSHAWAPLFFGIQFLQSYYRMVPLPGAQRVYWIGATLPILIAVVFLVRWQGIQREIAGAETQYFSTRDYPYPAWTYVSQHLPDDPMTAQVLMGRFTSPLYLWGGDGFGSLMNNQEFIEHNPLAVLASMLYGSLGMERNDLATLINSRYVQARHMDHRRLWSGEDLKTDRVETEVSLDPGHRLAYLSQTFVIENKEDGQQEAVYTLYLPEGAIATSLSLWVNGEESFSRLTTRKKADSAYVAIVGRERRDPALLHWQEGNRLTLKVFPCTSSEKRRVKVGLTCPLRLAGDRLVLDPLTFDGPDFHATRQQITVQPAPGATLTELKTPVWMTYRRDKATYQGSIHRTWEISCAVPPIQEDVFSFNGVSYRMRPPVMTDTDFVPEAVVLDLHAGWTLGEAIQTWHSLSQYPVYVFSPHLTRITEENHLAIFRQLQAQQFSLPLLYELPVPARTMILSKGSPGVFLSDLKGSQYAKRMDAWLAGDPGRPVWITLSDDIPPYVRTLKDFRVIHFLRGQAAYDTWTRTGRISLPQEDAGHVFLDGPQVSLVRDSVQHTGTGPDHLMRLFVSQRLLQEMGPRFFKLGEWESRWVGRAEEAYVTTPVSSLVVLETQEDYDRMGIEENTNTLGNASQSKSKGDGFGMDGSVPEPHEWVLILLVACMVLWMNRAWLLGLMGR